MCHSRRRSIPKYRIRYRKEVLGVDLLGTNCINFDELARREGGVAAESSTSQSSCEWRNMSLGGIGYQESQVHHAVVYFGMHPQLRFAFLGPGKGMIVHPIRSPMYGTRALQDRNPRNRQNSTSQLQAVEPKSWRSVVLVVMCLIHQLFSRLPEAICGVAVPRVRPMRICSVNQPVSS